MHFNIFEANRLDSSQSTQRCKIPPQYSFREDLALLQTWYSPSQHIVAYMFIANELNARNCELTLLGLGHE